MNHSMFSCFFSKLFLIYFGKPLWFIFHANFESCSRNNYHIEGELCQYPNSKRLHKRFRYYPHIAKLRRYLIMMVPKNILLSRTVANFINTNVNIANNLLKSRRRIFATKVLERNYMNVTTCIVVDIIRSV